MDQGSQDSGRPFHVMAKITGPLCNLNCGYCFYLEKERLYPRVSRWEMAPDLLESFIRQRIESERSPRVSFAWQGGEPTLPGVDYLARIVQLQRKYARKKAIENVLQTNGTLLDDELCAFLAEHQFLVGVSLDGPRDLHDAYRVDKGGKGSFDRVMRGIALLKKHGVEFNTLTVVHRLNSCRPVEVYQFLKEIGSRFMQFIPVVERTDTASGQEAFRLTPPGPFEHAELTEWSVQPLQYGKFLCAIFDEWVRFDVGSVFVQLFDVALESWIGIPASLCVFRQTCGDALVVEHNGDLYSCDHYVYPEHRLGNMGDRPLEALASSPKQEKFGRDKRDSLPSVCLECDVRFACHGECPKHRFALTPQGEGGLNYLCPGYKEFFRHIDPAMRFMAGELNNSRPPANVMRWVRGQTADRPGRSEPCSCGSGKKYKHCHAP